MQADKRRSALRCKPDPRHIPRQRKCRNARAHVRRPARHHAAAAAVGALLCEADRGLHSGRQPRPLVVHGWVWVRCLCITPVCYEVYAAGLRSICSRNHTFVDMYTWIAIRFSPSKQTLASLEFLSSWTRCTGWLHQCFDRVSP